MKIFWTTLFSVGATLAFQPVASAVNLGTVDVPAYVSARVLLTMQRANGMDKDIPRERARVGKNGSNDLINGSFAVGAVLFQQENGAKVRAELEYTLPREAGFTSYWSPFDANANEFQVRSQRLMVNGYYDYPIVNNLSVYGTAGVGLAFLKAGGWQGNTGRQFNEHSKTNFTYALGAGLNYALDRHISFELGYRFVDMGQMHTGLNKFANATKTFDEQLRGRIVAHEVFFGTRFIF